MNNKYYHLWNYAYHDAHLLPLAQDILKGSIIDYSTIYHVTEIWDMRIIETWAQEEEIPIRNVKYLMKVIDENIEEKDIEIPGACYYFQIYRRLENIADRKLFLYASSVFRRKYPIDLPLNLTSDIIDEIKYLDQHIL